MISYKNERKENLDQISQHFKNMTLTLEKVELKNERTLKRTINEFVVNFETNIQALISLANLFEEKTVYEVGKKKDSILELLSNDNVDPNTKLELATKKLDELKIEIVKNFETITGKITNYEKISSNKILRAKKNFQINLNPYMQ